MRRHRVCRPLATLVLLAVVAAGTAGCDKQGVDTKRDLLSALSATERLSHRLLYREAFTTEDGEEQTEVRGLVEDDFRYKVRVAVGGRPVLDEVVSDDTLAVRFLEPKRIIDFIRPPDTEKSGGEGVSGTDSDAPTGATPGRKDNRPNPVAALRTRRWVIDEGGAPSVFGRGDTAQLGADPVLDALDAFDYVRQAVGEATRVAIYNEESIEPVYRPAEDPFDKPAKGVLRYDFDAPNLPRAADRTGGNQVTPEARHFRKMAVYVKDGRVVKVDEVIDVAARLDDLARLYDTDFPDNVSDTDLAVLALGALNNIRKGQGADPVRLRHMVLQVTDLGDDITVKVPAGKEVVKASLAVLQNRGRPSEAEAGLALAEKLRSPKKK